jgi:ATP phosphoribosyltransferase
MKLALPKGRLLDPTKAWLQAAGIDLPDYDAKSRSYRITCSRFPELQIKVFNEKDIPVQVAIGNYDLGICGLDWIEELLIKYPSSAVIKVHDLGYGLSNLYAAGNRSISPASLDDLWRSRDTLRLAGEYPNLAEAFALDQRLRRFRIFPLWGSAEGYPPENADIVFTSQPSEASLAAQDLTPLATLFESSAHLIANKQRWEDKDMSELLRLLCLNVSESADESGKRKAEKAAPASKEGSAQEAFAEVSLQQPGLRLALPDGHQSKHVIAFLDKAGIDTSEYAAGSRRPQLGLEGVIVKVIRPQDMPLQVANGHFDLAITGKDWLHDHLCRFPTSPVEEILDLGFGWVRIVNALSRDLGIGNLQDLRTKIGTKDLPVLRIASEYTNIADKYAWDNHLSPYLIIPTWGASEAFLPEDADILIDNTETGRTLAEHGLDIIDTLFESTGCVIGSTDPSKQREIMPLIERLGKALD